MSAMTTTSQRAKSLLPRLATRIVIPLVGYTVLRPYVGSDAIALAIAAAVPTLWTIGTLVVRRRIDPIGLLSTVGFGVSLLLLWLGGGSSLAVKLGEPIVTGVLGIACLVSVAVGMPLYALILRRTGRPVVAARQLTAIVGTILFVHAAVVVVLAMTLSTTEFLAIGRLIGWAVLGVGVAGLFAYRRRLTNAARTVPDAGDSRDRTNASGLAPATRPRPDA